MSCARSAGLDLSGTVLATTWPRRMTVIRSDTTITSPSLWVMKMTAEPAFVRPSTTSKSLSASGGVSTDVGSSRISRRAPR